MSRIPKSSKERKIPATITVDPNLLDVCMAQKDFCLSKFVNESLRLQSGIKPKGQATLEDTISDLKWQNTQLLLTIDNLKKRIQELETIQKARQNRILRGGF